MIYFTRYSMAFKGWKIYRQKSVDSGCAEMLEGNHDTEEDALKIVELWRSVYG